MLPLLAARGELAVLVADHCAGNPRIPGEVALKTFPLNFTSPLILSDALCEGTQPDRTSKAV